LTTRTTRTKAEHGRERRSAQRKRIEGRNEEEFSCSPRVRHWVVSELPTPQ